MEDRHIGPGLAAGGPYLAGFAAVFFGLAVILGMPVVVHLFEPEYASYLLQDMMAAGITSEGVLNSYYFLHSLMTVLGTLFAAGLFLCLLMGMMGKASRGLSLASTCTQWLVWGINVVGVLLACLFVFRFIRYTILCFSTKDGLYPFYAMVVSEALMVALAGFVFVHLRRFLNCVCDSAASMAYSEATGELDSVPIPGYTATGFAIFGVVAIFLAVDQLFTVTIVYSYPQAYYKLLTSAHPVQLCSAGACLCSGAANFLLAGFLRRYKSACEWARYQARKKCRK